MYQLISHSFSIKLYNYLAIVITLCLQLGCSSTVESHNSDGAASQTNVAEHLSQAEKLFGERQDIGKLREAVKVLGAGRDPDRRNYQVEWTFAKYCYFLGKA